MFIASAAWCGAKPLPVPFQSDYQAEIWGLEEGFPENSCSGIVLAGDGYLWMGTFRGLVRFNGQEFKPWAPEAVPELRSTGIVTLFRDARSRIWISTLEGLVMNDGAKWRRWEEADGWGDRMDYIRGYAEDASGAVVFTRFSGRVLRFEDNHFTDLPTPPGTGGTLVGFDRDGNLYAVRTGFAGWLVAGAWQPLVDDPELGKQVVGAGQSRDGHALIISRREILRLRGGRVVARTGLSQNVGTFWQLAEDTAGTIWLPGVEAGVYRIRPDGEVRHYLKADGLPHSGGTRVVYPADDDSVWIGSGVGGLAHFRPIRFRYLGEEEGLGDREVLTLAPLRDGRVLFTPYGSGLRFFDGVDTVRPAALVGGNTLLFRTVLRAHDDTIWLGAFSKGLMRLEGSTLVPVASDAFGANETINTLFEDSRHRLWVGGDRSVAVREEGGFRAVTFPAEAQLRRPTLFAERRDGTILLARHHEIFAYDATGLRPTPIVGLPVDRRISTLLVDAKDRLWIGTTGHGLSVFHQGKLWSLPAERGLPGAAIGALVQDNQGRIWFGAGRNVVRADPEELWTWAQDHTREAEIQIFDRDDGMRDLDFPYGTQPNVAKDDRGQLWFALIRGAAMIDPASIKLNDRPPKVVIESISYVPDGGARPVELPVAATTAELTLPPGSRLIRINYAALDFFSPRKQRFRVRLGEGSGEWQDMERETTVSFLELPPGRHRLQVQASGSDGVWNRTGTSLAFVLTPFYWQTGWFRTLVGIALFGLVGGSVWFVGDRRTRVAQDKLERERRLADAQARLALVLENTTDFVAFANPQGDLLYVNRAGRDLIGLGAEVEVRTTTVASIMPPWARTEFTAVALPEALHRGPWSGESALLHCEGREIPVSQVLIAHRAPNGALDFTSMIARDISVAKRHAMVQDALRGLATALTAALEPPSLGRAVAQACRKVFAHDAFFLVLLDSAENVSLTAYMEDTPAGETAPRAVATPIRTLNAHFHPVLKGTPVLLNRAADERGTARPFSPWGFAERRSLSIMYAPVQWEGRVIGVVSLQSYTVRRYGETDLQQFQTLANHCAAAIARINAEELLRKNEERLRLAMQAARMGSWEIDLGTGRLLASPEASVVYGYAGDALSGPAANLAARIAEPEAAELRRLLDDLLHGHVSEIDHTHRLVLPDGSGRWLELKGRLEQRGEAGGAGRIIGVTADITSRRHAELERAKLEEQLRQSQKLEAIGTLAGGIAHDFNNILTAILGNADLAQFDLGSSHPAHEFLEKIKLSGQRARDLVRRILAFSRPHETHRQLTPLPIIVEEVVKLMRSTLPASVQLVVRADPATPLVEVDSTELHQVLLNLGTNASHALGGRPGMIEFALEPCTIEAGANAPSGLKPGRYAQITVSDNGKGIPAEILPRIFDPFFTTKGPGEGTGLGLSVAHGIIRASGGTITVVSAPGMGSTFELFLPAAEASQSGSAPSPVKSVPPAAPSPGQRLLVVDDEEMLVITAERMLRRAGFAVAAFVRPTEALAAFRAQPRDFDLVITDLSMPEMSGIALAHELLRLRPDLPIILMSGYLRPGDAEAARHAGIREIVEKPATPQDILPLIGRLLETRRAL